MNVAYREHIDFCSGVCFISGRHFSNVGSNVLHASRASRSYTAGSLPPYLFIHARVGILRYTFLFIHSAQLSRFCDRALSFKRSGQRFRSRYHKTYRLEQAILLTVVLHFAIATTYSLMAGP